MGRLGDSVGRAFVRPLKALLPKNPWIRLALIAVPILLVLALLEPVLSLFQKGLDVFVRLFTPLLDSPTGRLLLLNLILLACCVLGFLLLRARLRSFRSGLVLRRHLDAVEAATHDQPRRAADGFRRVARTSAALLPPPEYPAVVEDAKIKLARIALESGDIDTALRHVSRVRERHLPKELARSHAQIRARTLREQGGIHADTLRDELDAATKRFRDDAVLLGLAREVALDRADPVGAAGFQERVLDHAQGGDQTAMRTRLLEDLLRAGEHELAAGNLDAAQTFAKKARRLEPESASSGPGILAGRVALARGKVLHAVKEWGKTRSPAGLQEIARLLDEKPGVVSIREILESCPIQGAVLLVAREYARQGDAVRAERAARSAARELGLTPSVAAVLTEVLERDGRTREARQIMQEAVRGLLGATSAEISSDA